ncbi:hypothetical protein ATN50_17540 [Vibrio parahaemolyticus]|nr:hypothetical protein [Vibrio parahaemolyticus]RFD43966.1 hypothetical protein H330_014160 [Vibrio parahaemolyticus 3631]RFD52056.1 hypothetical protein H332_007385 [Vibrio parahaemolyticus 3646]EGR1302188.1 hypothetical protein [Vibrio parahaemolyticus]EGR1332615.1 hypothetical protein [Vibrio parahaemolyticus]
MKLRTIIINGQSKINAIYKEDIQIDDDKWLVNVLIVRHKLHCYCNAMPIEMRFGYILYNFNRFFSRHTIKKVFNVKE